MTLVTVEAARSSRSAVARKYNHFWGNNTMADLTEHEREVLNKLRDCPQISWERIRESKLKTFFVYHCIFIAVFGVLWLLLNCIGITYRTIPTFLIVGWSVLGLIISFWWWLIKSKIHLLIKVLIGLVGGGALAYGFFVAAFISIFLFTPEHVVQLDGHTYVAEVRAFLNVNVDYYKYYGPLLRGKTRIIVGDFGDGGYDPFTSDNHGTVEYHHMDPKGDHYIDSWTDTF